jgi:hypothetical protein
MRETAAGDGLKIEHSSRAPMRGASEPHPRQGLIMTNASATDCSTPHVPAVTIGSPSDIALTVEQKRFYEIYGFLVLPGLLAGRIQAITAGFEAVWEQRALASGDPAHDGTARSSVESFIDQDEVLSGLLDDPGIHGAACSLLGDDFNYMGSDGNYYVGDSSWHRDGGYRVLRFLKFAIYLDPLTAQTGALRVVPGSQELDDAFCRNALAVSNDPKSVGLTGAQMPAQVIESNPGDVVVFNLNILHSSWGGGARRRMFAFNLCQRCPENWVPQFRQYLCPEFRAYLAGNTRLLNQRDVRLPMIASATPQRLRHLEQLRAEVF